jgi:SAM-dependent methyltransferase
VSVARLLEHRQIWRDKPVLAQVYRPWFDALLDLVPPGGRALEVGTGPGFLAERARVRRPEIRLTTTDILPASWNQVVADALRLPVRRSSVDAVVGLDVVHHLARPAAFLAEAARVLAPGGRLGVVEPWVTPLSFPIYRWLHQEGCRPGLDPWNPFSTSAGEKEAFEGDAAVAWALVRRATEEQWAELGLTPPRVRVSNAFAYMLSLGFKPGSLLPPALAPFFQRVDEALGFAAALLGMRALLVWTKASG